MVEKVTATNGRNLLAVKILASKRERSHAAAMVLLNNTAATSKILKKRKVPCCV